MNLVQARVSNTASYKFSTRRASFATAESTCKAWGGHIFTPTSSAEDRLLLSKAKSRWEVGIIEAYDYEKDYNDHYSMVLIQRTKSMLKNSNSQNQTQSSGNKRKQTTIIPFLSARFKINTIVASSSFPTEQFVRFGNGGRLHRWTGSRFRGDFFIFYSHFFLHNS